MKSCLNIRCIFSLSELVEAEKLLDLHVYYSNGLVPQELYRSVVDCHVQARLSEYKVRPGSYRS